MRVSQLVGQCKNFNISNVRKISCTHKVYPRVCMTLIQYDLPSSPESG